MAMSTYVAIASNYAAYVAAIVQSYRYVATLHVTT